MVQNEGKWDVPPEVQEKVVHANCANAVDEDDVSDLKFVSVTNRHYLMVKRMLDIILALLALIGIATPMLVVFLMVYIDDPGALFFLSTVLVKVVAASSSIRSEPCGRIPLNICLPAK